jgi:hypothetical protein
MPEETNTPVDNDIPATIDGTVPVVGTNELKVLYTWKAPTRPFKKRDKEFWTTVIAIVFLVGLILFFVKEWFLIAAIISLTFVYYVLSTVPPEDIECALTNKGVRYAGQLHAWELFYRFWFSNRYGQRMVNLDMRTGLVGRLSLMVGSGEEKQIRETLAKYLVEETPKPTFMDNASDWLQKKVPLETDKNIKPTSKTL